jgi:hypothetical protein
MEKSPAFMLYSADFLIGVFGMTDADVGKYIKLLCLQHQKGRLTQELFDQICPEPRPDILEKFHKDKSGFIYNLRLEAEIIKRARYSKAQKDKISQRWDNAKNQHDTMVGKDLVQKSVNSGIASVYTLLEDENENENENEDKNENEKKNKKVEYPFNSANFIKFWKIWKQYKEDEHKFRYKSSLSEQGALFKLDKLSCHNEGKAIEIINQSISNGWKGFFEIKANGKGAKTNISDSYRQQLLNRLSGINFNPTDNGEK